MLLFSLEMILSVGLVWHLGHNKISQNKQPMLLDSYDHTHNSGYTLLSVFSGSSPECSCNHTGNPLCMSASVYHMHVDRYKDMTSE